MINCHRCKGTFFRSQGAQIRFDDTHMYWLCDNCLELQECGHWKDMPDMDCPYCWGNIDEAAIKAIDKRNAKNDT